MTLKATEVSYLPSVSRRDLLRLAGGVAVASAILRVNPAMAQSGTLTGGTYQGWWPYTPPPTGHFNTFVADAITLGIYQGVMELPLMHYRWESREFTPVLATEWKLEGSDVAVTLRDGVVWSDGSPFTADDVITTFTILRMQNHPMWQYLGSVTATDPHHVVFTMAEPSTVVPYYVLRAAIRAHSVYGAFAAKVQAAYDAADPTPVAATPGATPAGDDVAAPDLSGLVSELNAMKLDHLTVTGPYNVDTSTISSSQLTLSKVQTSYLAGTANFDRLVLFNQTDAASIPTLILAGNCDYSTSGFPPATEQAMLAAGLRIVRPPTYSGPSLWINYAKVKGLSDPKARGAVAQAIDRKTNGYISLSDSGMPSSYMCGVPDALIATWADEDVLAGLNGYPYDVDAATATFTSLGYTKDGDVWVSPDGERMEYEISVPGEYADWAAAATNLADQLTQFGIKATVRAITGPQWAKDQQSGNFQLGIAAWGSGMPHPKFSFEVDFISNNSKTDPENPGIGFNLTQTTSDGELDLPALVRESAAGLDEQAQRTTIAILARAFNELLPVIPLWERLANDPILVDKRVTGFPDDSDPLFKNSVYADNFTMQWILDGTLKGVV